MSVLFAALAAIAQEQRTAPSDATTPSASARQWSARNRTENQTEWYTVTYATNGASGQVRAITNSFTELASGLNRRDALGQWRAATPAFQITANGVEATGATHRVTLAGNINSAGAVQIEKDGVKMQGHPLCVGYYDPVDGRSELLGELVDASGWLVASNEVVFSNCFNGIRASIRYRNTRAGLEQDLLLHERLPVAPADLGFSGKTRLELFTEWIGDTPMPEQTTRLLEAEKDAALRQQMREPDFSDATLKFGGLQMPSGRAFSANSASTAPGGRSSMESVSVGKRFEIIDGRKIVIEAVPIQRAQPMLDKLPAAKAVGVLTNAALRNFSKTNGAMVATTRPLPAKRLAQANSEARIQTAAIDSNPKPETGAAELAFVLDWQVVPLTGSLNNHVFRGTNTYFVNGQVSLTGTTTFEGGTVVKYGGWGNFPSLNISGPVVCETSDYSPAIFTGMDDDSVGESVLGSTGTPGGVGYGNPSLAFYGPGVSLKHFRMSYSAGSPLAFFNETEENQVWHSQFLNCWSIWAQNNSLALFNVLFNANYGWAVVEGYDYLVRAEHLTAHSVFLLADDYTGNSSVKLTNSLLIDVLGCWSDLQPGSYEWFDYEPPTSVFQTVGAGNHYLADSPAYHNGTTDIDPTLRADLSNRTTRPPEVLTGTITENLTLSPRNLGDTGELDYGYHYPILDYALNLRVDNATVLITNGVALATFGQYALWLNGSRLVSEGTPARLNTFAPYTAVQEQHVNWAGNSLQGSVTFQTETFYGFGQIAPEIDLRFTSLACARSSDCHLNAWSGQYILGRLSLRDCHLKGGIFQVAADGYPLTVGLTNNVFEAPNRITLGLGMDVYAFNNLFLFCPTIDLSPSAGSVWQMRDNLFHSCWISDYGGDLAPQHDHNGFFETVYDGWGGAGYQMLPANGNQLLNSLTYEKGPFGRFYLPATVTALTDTGSRSAAEVGLFHYTTRTTQAKEGSSQVDIGVHYVAATVGNQPIDGDGDSLADYFEDRNGNGTYQSTDLGNFISPDSDGDGLNDGYEFFTTHTGIGQADTGNTGTSDGYKDSDGDGLTNIEESKLGSDPLQPNVAAPIFNPVGRIYSSAQNVTVTCPTPDAVIHYEINFDFIPPSETSPVIDSGNAVLIADPHPARYYVPLQARAWKSGWIPSDLEIQTYLFEPLLAPPTSHQPPTVTIAPAGGGTYLASDSIEILVEASASDGPVFKLQLYRGNYKVAEIENVQDPITLEPSPSPGPLRYVLNNVPSGSYTYTAKAIDWCCGAVTMSAPITININASGPVVTLNGAQPFFTSSPATLLASVRGVNPNALTTLTLNGAPLVPRAGEFNLNAALVAGENTFTLVATDNQNRTGQATTKVYLDSVAPVVAITAPANNATFNTTRVNVLGTFTESSLKRITVNGVPALITGAGTFEVRNVPLVTGANVLTTRAEDIAGNITTAAITITGGATLVDPLQLTVTPVGGFAPLSTTFSLVGNYPGTLQNVYYDFEGDASFPGGAAADQTEANLNSINHTYSTAGQYFPVVTLQTTAGRFSSVGGWNASPALRVNVQQPPVVPPGSTITINDPVDLKIGGPSAHLFVLSRSGVVVKEYDSTPNPIRSIALPSGSVPTGLDADSDGNVYVALGAHHQVAKYKLVNGAYTPDTAFNGTGLLGKGNQTSGTGNGEFNTPFDVAVTLDGEEIAVSDSANHRIQRFTKNGLFVDSFGQLGNVIGQFNNPKGLTYDEKGYLYAADSGNGRIALALSSVVLGISGSSGTALGQFQGMVNLGVGARGIYVADAGNNRVQQFDGLRGGHAVPTPFSSRGALSVQFTPALNQPNSVATVTDFREEKIYIADTGNNRVVLIKLPLDNPEAVWAAMKGRVNADDINGAIGHFSILSAEEYRQTFTSIGLADLKPLISQIPAITPVVIYADTAQYRFERVVQGFTITFPIEFVKENGVWKIDSY